MFKKFVMTGLPLVSCWFKSEKVKLKHISPSGSHYAKYRNRKSETNMRNNITKTVNTPQNVNIQIRK